MKAYCKTFGCQQNVRDSETAAGLLVQCGYALTDTLRDADVIFINTCAIRAHAENKVLSYLGRLKKLKQDKPTLQVIVCGCMPAQPAVAAKLKEQFPQVDIIMAPDALPKLPQLLADSLSGAGRQVDTQPNATWHEPLPVARGAVTPEGVDNSEALVTVMSGCDNYCSYCIVPYVRGRERSRRVTDVLSEVQAAVAGGFSRIMLLGQNVNAYHDGDADFPALLRAINEIDGDFTVRFMTSHPKDADVALFDALAQCDKLEKHLHLPVQSGSSAVLKAMNRKYGREQYLAKVTALRERLPAVRLTSDIIVGFPGETEADFADTLSLVEQVRFDQLFTFLFSPRRGTPAASMADAVPDEVKKERFARLLALQKRIETGEG